ncbi:hypothetical protein FOZ63_024661, partial [Perkinsus olseni]
HCTSSIRPFATCHTGEISSTVRTRIPSSPSTWISSRLIREGSVILTAKLWAKKIKFSSFPSAARFSVKLPARGQPSMSCLRGSCTKRLAILRTPALIGWVPRVSTLIISSRATTWS